MKNNIFKIFKTKKAMIIGSVSIVTFGMFLSSNISAFLPIKKEATTWGNEITVVQQGRQLILVQKEDQNAFNTYIKKAGNEDIYCMEHTLPSPDGVTYKKGSIVTDKAVRYILEASTGYGEGSEENYYIKQLALNYYLYSIGYVNNENLGWVANANIGTSLRDKALNIVEQAIKVENGTVPNPYASKSLSIKKGADNVFEFNNNTGYYETDYFEIESSNNLKSYSVSFGSNSPSNIKMVDEGGNVVTSLDSNKKKFKLKVHKDNVSKSYSEVAMTITGSFDEKNVYLYEPKEGTYQDVVVICDDIATLSVDARVGLLAVGHLKVVKKDDEGNLLKNVVFDLKQGNATIDTKTTNNSGEILFSDLEVGNYTLIEKSVPNNIVLNATPIDVTVQGGMTIEKEVTNEIIRGRVSIEKEDSEIPSLKLQNVQFTIYDNAGNIVDTLTTDSNGYAQSRLLNYGSYTMKETSFPEGYKVNPNPTVYNIEIKENNRTYHHTAQNDVIKGKIQIVKVDSENEEEPVEGAGFDVIAENVPGIDKGTVVEHITTNADGFAFTGNLRYGRYKIRETVTPSGYWQSNKDYFMDILEDGKTYVRYIKNDAVQSKIRAIKTDGKTKFILKGVQFKIVNKDSGSDVVFKEYKNGQVVDKTVFTTDENGEFMTPQALRIGNYQLVEVKTNEGYVLAEPIDFTIDNDAPIEDIEIIGTVMSIPVENQRIKGGLKIIKTDEYTSEPLEGVEFLIECVDGFNKGETYTQLTNKDGEIILNDLEYGTYSVKEVSTVEGYVLNKEVFNFNIEVNEQVVELNIANKPIEGYIELYKVDKETQRKLKDTVFEIWSPEGVLVAKLTTDENGYAKSDKLLYGTYYLVELTPSEGYILDREKIHTIKIEEENKVYKIEEENQRKKGFLSFIKLDSLLEKDNIKEDDNDAQKPDSIDDVDEGLENSPDSSESPEDTEEALVVLKWGIFGAKIQIKGLEAINEDILMTFESESAPSIIELPIGEYEIKELQPPEGYVLDDKVYNFVIKHDETTEVSIENKPIEGYIEIIKVDSETKRKLEGVKFEIYTKTRELVETLITDEIGYAKSGKLKYGQYYVIESEPAEGYKKDDGVIHNVGVKEEGKVYTINMENDRKVGSLSFEKTDSSSGEILEGATIEIKGLDKINEDVNLLVISKSEGNEIKLPVGKYSIKETISPSNYKLNSKEGSFNIKDEGSIEEYKIKNKKIVISKPLTGDNMIMLGMTSMISLVCIVIFNRKNI